MNEHFRLIRTGDTGDVFCNGDVHVRITRQHDSKDGKDFRIANVVCACASRQPPVSTERAPA